MHIMGIAFPSNLCKCKIYIKITGSHYILGRNSFASNRRYLLRHRHYNWHICSTDCPNTIFKIWPISFIILKFFGNFLNYRLDGFRKSTAIWQTTSNTIPNHLDIVSSNCWNLSWTILFPNAWPNMIKKHSYWLNYRYILAFFRTIWLTQNFA